MKKRNIFAILFLFALPIFGQVNSAPMPLPVPQFFSATGLPLSGGKVFTYAAGTTTPLATYTDGTGLVQNSNPILLNAGGYPVNASGSVVGIWLGPQKYHVILQNSIGVQQWSVDQVGGNNLLTLTNLNVAEQTAPTCTPFTGILWADSSSHRWKMCNNGVADYVVGQSTTDILTNKTLVNPTLLNPSFSGNYSIAQLNTSTYYASQYSGSDASCKIATAISTVSGTYGVINAIDLTDSGGTGACTIDPGSKTIWLLLGANTYHITQIIARTNLRIIGMGDGQGISSTKPMTALQAMGSDIQPPITLGSTTNEGQEGIFFSGFRLLATAGNITQSGIKFVGPIGGGFWYADMENLTISGFGGIGLDLEALVTVAPNGIHQFSNFRSVKVFRPNGGQFALQIKGFNNSLVFENCQFDGSTVSAGGDGGTNINIQDVAGITFPPYNIMFKMLTCQWAGVCMQVNGADSVTIDQPHFEGISGVLQVGAGASFGSQNITMHDGGAYNGSGVNAGNGFIVNLTAAAVNASVNVENFHAIAAPDNYFKGNTDGIYQCGNTVGPEGSYKWLLCSMRNSNTIALATALIGANACTAAQTTSIPGLKTSSVLTWNFTTTPVGVTGYAGATPSLVVTVFPTADTGNAVVCNTSAGGITPGAISIRIAGWNTVP